MSTTAKRISRLLQIYDSLGRAGNCRRACALAPPPYDIVPVNIFGRHA